MLIDRSQTVEIALGHKIHIAEAGTLDGPPIVFVHGSRPSASGASNFSQNVDAFAAAGYRVILPDLIGYGRSSKPEGIDYTIDLFSSTLVDALAKTGVDQATYVGNSLGGGIELKIALDRPHLVGSMVLMAPGCIEEREKYFSMPVIAKIVSSFGSDDFTIEEQRKLVTNLVFEASSITDELVAERHAVAKTQPKDVLARMKTPNLQPRLSELKQPILVFWGVEDEFCPDSGSGYFLKQCRNARCISFTEVGHWVQVERAPEFNAYALEFLNA